MNVNTQMQQQVHMRKMDGSGEGKGMGKMVQETMQILPTQTQTDVRSSLQALDVVARKEAMTQISQLDTSNMSVDDLTTALMDIVKPQEAVSISTTSLLDLYA